MSELMGRQLAFVDTETDSLDVSVAMPWEVAVIIGDHRHLMQVDISTESSDPDSLRFGGYYDRFNRGEALSPSVAASVLSRILDGVTLVAANPAYDAAVLANLMGAPVWDYHLVDVEAMALGWMSARGVALPDRWKSHDLSRLCGVEPPSKGVAHTALGDAKWVQRWYERLAG